MHMTCGSCRLEFCWLCKGEWKSHGEATGGFYSCNKFDKKKADQEEADIKNLKSELETFIWYWHRYDSQLKAEDFAKTQKKNVEKKK